MQRPTWLIVAVVVGLIWWTSRPGAAPLTPVVPPPGGPDLVAVFSQSDDPCQAAQDAADLGRLCKAIARQIEYDGTRPQPRLTTGQQMDDVRRWAREYFTAGKSLGVQYPLLVPAVKTFLDSQLGTAGGPVSLEQRAKWVAAYHTLAQSAEYAATKL